MLKTKTNFFFFFSNPNNRMKSQKTLNSRKTLKSFHNSISALFFFCFPGKTHKNFFPSTLWNSSHKRILWMIQSSRELIIQKAFVNRESKSFVSCVIKKNSWLRSERFSSSRCFFFFDLLPLSLLFMDLSRGFCQPCSWKHKNSQSPKKKKTWK